MTVSLMPSPPAPTPAPVRAATARLYALDGLRLLCALAVAGYHFGDSSRVDGVRPPAAHLPHAAPVLIYGFLGVEVFFLISGFVIGMSGWDRTARDFLVSRAARLYPAFWCCALVTAAVVWLWPISAGLPITTVPSLTDVALNLTMVPSLLGVAPIDSVYWTLLVEICFYLAFAVVIGVGVSLRRVTIFCAAWLALSVLPVPLGQLVMPDFAPYFVAGLVMYLMRRFGPDRWLWLLLGASWLVALVRVDGRVSTLRPGFEVPAWPALVLITVAFAVVLAIALGATDRLRWRWLATAGGLTYPFYLLHQRVGYAMIRAAYERLDLPLPVLIAGATIALLCAAWLVYRLVERPLRPLLLSLGRPVAAGRAPDM